MLSHSVDTCWFLIVNPRHLNQALAWVRDFDFIWRLNKIDRSANFSYITWFEVIPSVNLSRSVRIINLKHFSSVSNESWRKMKIILCFKLQYSLADQLCSSLGQHCTSLPKICSSHHREIAHTNFQCDWKKSEEICSLW